MVGLRLWGTVRRVVPEGVVVSGAILDDEYHDIRDPWIGTFFLAGHPRQHALQEGDRIQGVKALQLPNYNDGVSVIRAYRFLATG